MFSLPVILGLGQPFVLLGQIFVQKFGQPFFPLLLLPLEFVFVVVVVVIAVAVVETPAEESVVQAGVDFGSESLGKRRGSHFGNHDHFRSKEFVGVDVGVVGGRGGGGDDDGEGGSGAVDDERVGKAPQFLLHRRGDKLKSHFFGFRFRRLRIVGSGITKFVWFFVFSAEL